MKGKVPTKDGCEGSHGRGTRGHLRFTEKRTRTQRTVLDVQEESRTGMKRVRHYTEELERSESIYVGLPSKRRRKQTDSSCNDGGNDRSDDNDMDCGSREEGSESSSDDSSESEAMMTEANPDTSSDSGDFEVDEMKTESDYDSDSDGDADRVWCEDVELREIIEADEFGSDDEINGDGHGTRRRVVFPMSDNRRRPKTFSKHRLVCHPT